MCLVTFVCVFFYIGCFHARKVRRSARLVGFVGSVGLVGFVRAALALQVQRQSGRAGDARRPGRRPGPVPLPRRFRPLADAQRPRQPHRRRSVISWTRSPARRLFSRVGLVDSYVM